MPLHVSSTCVHYQEVKIAINSLWYHHTETSEWSKITKTQFYKYEQIVKFICEFFGCDYCVLKWNSWRRIGSDGDVLLTPYVPEGYDDDD